MRPDLLAYLMTLDDRGAEDSLAEHLTLLEEVERRTRAQTATYGKRSAKSFLAPARPSWNTIH